MPYAGFSATTSLSGAEIAAIELLVKTTGQQAVDDLEKSLAGLNRRIELEAQAFQQLSQAGRATTRDTLEFIETLKKLEAQQKHATDSHKAAQNAQAGVSNQFKTTGQAALQLSYALDDIQYGFASIVNNAPQLALALGGGPGLAGAMGIAFVAANFLIKKLPDLTGAVQAVVPEVAALQAVFGTAHTALETYQATVKAIADKPLKFEVDYANMRTLTREIETATKAMKEFDAINQARTESQEKAHKSMVSGIVEAGGAGGKFEDAMIEIEKKKGTYGQGSMFQQDVVLWKAAVDKAQSTIDQAGAYSPVGQAAFLAKRFAESKLAGFEAGVDEEARNRIKAVVSMRRGDADAKMIAAIAADQANAPVFAKFGIDPLRLRAGAEGATAGFVQEQEKRKVDAARKKKEDAIIEDKIRADNQAEQASIDEAQRQVELGQHESNRLTAERLDVQKEFADNITKGVKIQEQKAEKAKAARKKRVDEVDQIYAADAAAMMAAQELGTLQGLPTARDRRQELQMQAMGQNYVLPGPVLARRIEEDIANKIGPARADLAPDIRARAGEMFDLRKTEAIARTQMRDPAELAGQVNERQAQILVNQEQTASALNRVLEGFLVQAGKQEVATQRNANQASQLLNRQQGMMQNTVPNGIYQPGF